MQSTCAGHFPGTLGLRWRLLFGRGCIEAASVTAFRLRVPDATDDGVPCPPVAALRLRNVRIADDGVPEATGTGSAGPSCSAGGATCLPFLPDERAAAGVASAATAALTVGIAVATFVAGAAFAAILADLLVGPSSPFLPPFRCGLPACSHA